MQTLQLASILLEALIAVLCLGTALKGRRYMLGLAFTFSVYVYYDLARLYSWNAPEDTLRTVFFLATLTALASVWSLFRRS